MSGFKKKKTGIFFIVRDFDQGIIYTVKPRYNDEVFHKIYIVIGRISLYQRRAYIQNNPC